MKQTFKILLLLLVCTSCTIPNLDERTKQRIPRTFPWCIWWFGQSHEEHLRIIKEKADNMPRVVSEESRLRDKTYIEYTVREWMNNDYEDFHYLFNDYTPENREKVRIHVKDIFYSPDSLKLISFVIIEEPVYLSMNEWNKKVAKTDVCFNGHILVGFRDISTKPWKLYFFPQFKVYDDPFIEKSQNTLIHYMFETIKSYSFAGFEENGEWGFCSFKYNLDEPEFWTGPVFDKSCFKGEGYFFQIDDFRSPEYIKGKRDTVPFFKIDYPKELIEQFDK